MTEEHRVTLAGYQTRVLEVAGAGPPVLFLHGYADSADTWRPVLRLLQRKGRAAAAMDLPGFGEADHLKRRPILPQYDAFMEAALSYVRERNGGQVVVAGNSLGGCAALRLAERNESGLAGVIAVAPAGLDMGRWFVVIEGERLLRWLLALPVPVPRWMIQQVVGQMYLLLAFSNPAAVSAEAVRSFTSHFRDRQTITRYLATGRRLLPELRDPFHLSDIRCPLMVVWGLRDRMVFPSGAERIRADVPAARIELIPGCGHCPQVEEPERFVALVSDFLTKLES
jgi:pimeloyl-ACP methyl ester carboxylesterase